MKKRMFHQEYFYNEDLWYINTAPKSRILNVELAGHTHADASYHIRRQKQWDMYIIEYVISGRGYIRCDGKTDTLQAGDAYIIRSFTDHEYWSDPDNPYEKVWMNVSGSLVDHLMAAFHLSGNVTVTHADISRMFEAIHKSLSTGYRTEELAQQPLRIFFCISEAAATKEGARLSLAERIHQYIDKNIGHGITSAKVAEHFQLSPIYAARVFKAHYLLTIAQYIQNSKLNLAAQLLRSSDLSVGDRSDYLGYCNDNYFSRLFKAYYGISPKQYQMRSRDGLPCNTPKEIPSAGKSG